MNSEDLQLETRDFIDRLQRQDRDAFQLLVKHYHSRLLGFATSITGETFAEEIVQEAWVAIWRGLSGFEGRAALKTWLYTIVRNECTAKLRREKRVQTLSIDDDMFEEGIDEWLAANFNDTGHWKNAIAEWQIDSPEQLLEEEQLRDCLEKNMVTMQAIQRSVFRLRDIEQIPLDDICNILTLSSSNVRVLLHRARLKLLQVIDRYQETGEC